MSGTPRAASVAHTDCADGKDARHTGQTVLISPDSCSLFGSKGILKRGADIAMIPMSVIFAEMLLKCCLRARMREMDR